MVVGEAKVGVSHSFLQKREVNWGSSVDFPVPVPPCTTTIGYVEVSSLRMMRSSYLKVLGDEVVKR